VKDAIGAVSKILRNTPAICRKCYIHPAVLETYLSGEPIEGLKRTIEKALTREDVEAAILKFLKTRLAKKAT
jgi:DNA topoisomerase I